MAIHVIKKAVCRGSIGSLWVTPYRERIWKTVLLHGRDRGSSTNIALDGGCMNLPQGVVDILTY